MGREGKLPPHFLTRSFFTVESNPGIGSAVLWKGVKIVFLDCEKERGTNDHLAYYG